MEVIKAREKGNTEVWVFTREADGTYTAVSEDDGFTTFGYYPSNIQHWVDEGAWEYVDSAV